MDYEKLLYKVIYLIGSGVCGLVGLSYVQQVLSPEFSIVERFTVYWHSMMALNPIYLAVIFLTLSFVIFVESTRV